MTRGGDEEILRSWSANARAWVGAVVNDVIESRIAITNAAIVDAVARHAPATVLDVGCGEGWLVRALAARGIGAAGIDAVPELIERAKAHRVGAFEAVSYEELIDGAWRPEKPFDAAVCNFALLGERVVEDLLRQLPALLTGDGRLFVQTVHPASQAEPDGTAASDGWRLETWQAFGGGFERPAPWYFRNRESWVELFGACGYRVLEIEEPCRPGGERPESLLFVCRVGGPDRR